MSAHPCLCLCLFRPCPVCVRHPLRVLWWLSVSLCRSVSLPTPPSFRRMSVCFHVVSISVSDCVCLHLFLFLCLRLRPSTPLSLSLFVSLSLCHSFSFFVSVSVSPSLSFLVSQAPTYYPETPPRVKDEASGPAGARKASAPGSRFVSTGAATVAFCALGLTLCDCDC